MKSKQPRRNSAPNFPADQRSVVVAQHAMRRLSLNQIVAEPVESTVLSNVAAPACKPSTFPLSVTMKCYEPEKKHQSLNADIVAGNMLRLPKAKQLLSPIAEDNTGQILHDSYECV